MENQEIYQQNFNQTLRDGLSNNGWTVPQITQAQLITDLVLDPASGQMVTLKNLMPDGTIWCIVDTNTPPNGLVYVGKLGGNLVQFTTTAYP